MSAQKASLNAWFLSGMTFCNADATKRRSFSTIPIEEDIISRMKISSSTAKALAALSLGGAVLQLSSDSTSGSFLDIFSSVTTTSQRRLEISGKGHFENLPFESLREPTWGDWIRVHDAIIHWIDMTSCPANGDPAFLTHWDNPDDHKALGSPMSDDCQLFLRERNPDQFGSRLVRHAFHDAVGGFDGWVNHQ